VGQQLELQQLEGLLQVEKVKLEIAATKAARMELEEKNLKPAPSRPAADGLGSSYDGSESGGDDAAVRASVAKKVNARLTSGRDEQTPSASGTSTGEAKKRKTP
jgi:hypothetical protein